MIERRRSQRVTPDTEIFVTVKSAERARVLDLSSCGAGLELFRPLSPSVECDLALPDRDGTLRIRAVVRRCRLARVAGGGGTVYQAGLEFLDLEGDQVETIEDTIVEICLTEVQTEAR